MLSSIASFLFGSSSNNILNSDNEEKLEERSNINKNQEHILKDTDNCSIKHSDQILPEKNKRTYRKKTTDKNESRIVDRENVGSPGNESDLLESDWCFVERDDLNTSNSFSRAALEQMNLDANLNRTSTPVLEILSSSETGLKRLQQQNTKNGFQKKRNVNQRKRKPNGKARDETTSPFSIDKSNGDGTSSKSSNNFIRNKGSNGIFDRKIRKSGTPHSEESGHNSSGASLDSNSSGAKLFTLVDSWYLTPPPCFTSKGPVHMEVSPLENLLIEHPSMSVYRKIKSLQKSVESAPKIDLKMKEPSLAQTEASQVRVPSNHHQRKNGKENVNQTKSHKQMPLIMQQPKTSLNQNTQRTTESRSSGPRLDRFSAAQLKMEMFAWNSQKCETNRNNQNLCRSNILRSNKVREIQSRGNRPRRSDMQHCRLVSGVNNNRKCCY